MGSWGTGILEDDLAADIYDSYMDMLDSKKAHQEIRKELENNYHECIEDEEEQYSYWLGLAKAQWECGILEKDVHQIVNEFIDSDVSLSLWGAEDEKDYSARKKKLAQFQRTISKVKSKPRKPKKYRFVPAFFKAGDCLIFKIPDGRYGAALVLDIDNSEKREGSTLCGLLDYVSHDKPPKDIYENRKWLSITHHSWNGRVEITWYGANSISTAPEGLEVIYNTDILPSNPKSSSWSGWSGLKQLSMQVEWDTENHKS